jgi:hypothetical protein
VLPIVAELLSEMRMGQPGCDMAMEALVVRILVQLLRRTLAISLMP